MTSQGSHSKLPREAWHFFDISCEFCIPFCICCCCFASHSSNRHVSCVLMQNYPLLPTLALKKVVLYLSVQLPEPQLLSVALVLENSFSWLWSSISDIPFGLKMAFQFGGRLDLLMAFRSSNLCLGDLEGLQLIASEMCLLGSPPCPGWWPPLTCALGSDLYAGGMFCPKVPPIKLPLTGSLWGTPPQCTRRCS